jgi:two-component system, NarL family, response regulator LiaR
MSPKIRLLIADDHGVLREGLRKIFEGEADMELVGEARDGVEAVEKALELVPDVLLIDLAMPRKNGIEAIREIKARNASIHILVLTSFAEDDHIFPAIEAGALGYMLKDTTAANLIQAVRIVNRDEPSLHPEVARRLMQARTANPEVNDPEEALTNREKQVLVLLAHGLTNQEIADQLFVGETTVRSHVSNILGKCHLTNRTQAALYALRQGLVDFDA